MIAPVGFASTGARSTTDLLQTVSASRLVTFHQCRLKFFFRYVLELPKPKPPSLFVGTTVHVVLQAWNKARWRGAPVEPNAFRPVFERSWTEGRKEAQVNWDGTESEERDGAWKLLETYWSQTPIRANERIEGVEVSVEAKLDREGLPTLVGVLDLVREGGRIVDFKTAAQPPTPEKALHLHETQLACYALLYREATGARESALELHHLVKLKTPKLVVTAMEPMLQRQLDRLFRLLESYMHGVECSDWVPNPNPMTCPACEYFQECRNWG